MSYLKASFSGWLNTMSMVFTIAGIGSYLASDVFHMSLPLPSWIALLVGVVAFVFVSWNLWHGNATLASAFRESLKSRIDEVILGWEKLVEDYQNSPKEEGQSPTVPNPMDPGWVGYGFKVWPYRVGFLQAATIALQRDLRRASIESEQWNYQTSMAQLLNVLRKYEKQVAKLK